MKIIRIPLRYFLAALAILVVLSTIVPVLYTLYWPLSVSKEKADIRIRFGTTSEGIADELVRLGIVNSAQRFKWALFLMNKKSSLRAGHFALPLHNSNYRVIKALTEGPQIYTKVTIPEGLRAFTIARLFAKAMELDSTRFMNLVNDTAFVRRLGIPAPNLEGFLLPETYMLTFGMNEKQSVQTLVQQFKKTVWDTLYERSQELGFTVREAMTLASIVQAEAKVDSELTLISSVYHNRLHVGMPLQADPTIQYLLPDGPRRLLLKDLEINSPYNTYLYPGLPPGPINNPGRQAILAALHPAESPYLYFVADGRGRHYFSTTLAQHLRAKRNLDILRHNLMLEKRNLKRRG
jgi:UPF0755 protein